MDGYIMSLLIAVLTGQGLSVAIPIFLQRRNGRNHSSPPEGFQVQSKEGGWVCVYHAEMKKSVDRIDENVQALLVSMGKIEGPGSQG